VRDSRSLEFFFFLDSYITIGLVPRGHVVHSSSPIYSPIAYLDAKQRDPTTNHIRSHDVHQDLPDVTTLSNRSDPGAALDSRRHHSSSECAPAIASVTCAEGSHEARRSAPTLPVGSDDDDDGEGGGGRGASTRQNDPFRDDCYAEHGKLTNSEADGRKVQSILRS